MPGGKGGNQAVAAARLAGGRPVRMVGRVGDDGRGTALLDGLARAGVDATGVRRTAGVPTGTALICVADDGQNTIVVAPGANGRLSAADVEPVDAAAVLLQLEVPLATVADVAAERARHATVVILDPAPRARRGTCPMTSWASIGTT